MKDVLIETALRFGPLTQKKAKYRIREARSQVSLAGRGGVRGCHLLGAALSCLHTVPSALKAGVGRGVCVTSPPPGRPHQPSLSVAISKPLV